MLTLDHLAVSPPGLLLTYVEDRAVPVFATSADGVPYTGQASASYATVDWTGTFKDGKPHGEFRIIWGDRLSGPMKNPH